MSAWKIVGDESSLQVDDLGIDFRLNFYAWVKLNFTLFYEIFLRDNKLKKTIP